MKKLIAMLASLTLLTSVVMAENHVTESFITPGIVSITVSNKCGCTNLLSPTCLLGANATGLIYTNGVVQYGAAGPVGGVQTVVGALVTNIVIGISTNIYSPSTNVNLLTEVPLWWDNNASFIPLTNNAVAVGMYNSSIYIRIIGQSGASSAVTFIFAPVVSDTLGEDTVSGDRISIAVTANTTTEVDSLTPLDVTKLIGVKKLRLISVTNGSTSASSAVTVLACALVGFHP